MSNQGSLGEAFVTIRGDGTKFPADIDSTVTSGVTEVVKKGAKILGGLVLAAKLKDQFKEGLAELEESLAVAAQTTAAIAATGGVAGVTAGHVAELAGSMTDLAGVDDELIAKGANLLLSFTSVANQGEGMLAIFDRATVAGLDLATRGFGSVESNARLLGLALSDPEVGLTKLRKAGILLTDQQIAAIDAFTKVGNLLGAQGVILDAIEGKVGGAAEQYGKTLPGKLMIAQQSLINLKAELVSGAAPAMEFFAEKSKTAVDAIQGLPDPIKDVIGGIGLLAFVAGGIVQPISGLSTTLTYLATRRAAAAAATALETEALVANTGATTANATAKTGGLSSALGKAGMVAAAAAATYGMYAYGQSLNKTSLDSEDLTRITKMTGDQIIDGMDQIISKSKGPFANLFDDALEGLAEKGPEGIGVLQRLRDHYAAIGDSEHLGQVDAALKAVSESQANLNANAAAGADTLEAQEEALAAAGKAAEGFAGFIDNLTGAMDRSYAVSGKWYGVTLTNKDLLVAYEANVDSLAESLAKNTLTTDIHTEAGRTNYAALRQTGEGIVNLIKNHVDEGASLDEAIQWGDKYVGNLRTQLTEAGYNEQQISDMIAEINLTPADIRTEFSNNAVEQQLVIGEFLAQLDTIKPEYRAQIRAAIEAGEYDKAQAALDTLAAGRTIDLHISAPSVSYRLHEERGVTYYRPTSGGVTYFATGGAVDAPRGQPVPAVLHGGEYVMNTNMVDAIKRGVGYAASGSQSAVASLLSTFKELPGYRTLSDRAAALTASSATAGRTDPFTASGLAALNLMPSGSAAYRALQAEAYGRFDAMTAANRPPQVVKQYHLNFPTLPADATLTPARVGTVLRRIEALEGG